MASGTSFLAAKISIFASQPIEAATCTSPIEGSKLDETSFGVLTQFLHKLIGPSANYPSKLREFATFAEAFAFDEACRADGTGGRSAKYVAKPKSSVPVEQRAICTAIADML